MTGPVSIAQADVPVQGQLVEVRRRPCVVTEVSRGVLPPALDAAAGHHPQHLVTLTTVDDEGMGEQLSVVWEIEPGAAVRENQSLPEPTGFDPPDRLDAFLRAVRWGAVSSADERTLQSPFRSGIQIEDYQLDPVARALRMPRVSLLVADDVGLGKTVEAGLVVQELLLRHRARTVLVVCPASLQIQWRDQMLEKFGLEFRIVDADLMRELRRTSGVHVNPWTHFPRLITSLDYLKRDRQMRSFREALPGEGEPKYPRRFDLLIVDEAHNVAPVGRGPYAVDSLRTTAIRSLVPHFEHKLFLSATPHNGDEGSFSALLELLDDQRFARAMKPDRRQLEAVMVRRLKTEIMDWNGQPRFQKREVVALEVDYPEAERQAHADLSRYTALRVRRSEGSARYATEFVLKLLKKRLFSSPAAFAGTLARHRRSLGLASAPALFSEDAIRRRVADLDEEYADDDLFEEALDDAVGAAGGLLALPDDDEARLLDRLTAFAQPHADGRPDAKAARLLDWLRETLLEPSGEWGDRRVILFTEYRATQKWLHDLLAQHGLATGDRLMMLYGGMQKERREAVKAAFQADPRDAPVRILLATDAASEGLDLQNHCNLLIHYEIPWNPARLEQRNGRIDRHGQRRKPLVHHFVGADWRESAGEDRLPGDLEGDLEFLAKAVAKVEQIREDLGKVGPVIAAQVEEAMLGRRRALDTDSAERVAAKARQTLKIERNLREQLAALRDQITETRTGLDLTPEAVRHVVETGLRLDGQPPLVPAAVEGIWPDPQGRRTDCPVFMLPPLTGAWAQAAEGIEHPHTRRRRPIVFDEALARGRDDVVLAHLNHRLVQMSLSLLRAQIWAGAGNGQLHRVTARLVPDHVTDTPVVAAHARLLVLGGDTRRLSEEVVAVAGRIRGGSFSRLPIAQADAVLAAALPDPAPESFHFDLASLWPRIEPALKKALDKRAEERMTTLGRQLENRAEAEIGRMRGVLEELAATIRTQLAAELPLQLSLFGPEDGESAEQFRRDRAALAARLDRIPDDIERETVALRARYAQPTPRLFPVCVTFLIPQSLAR